MHGICTDLPQSNHVLWSGVDMRKNVLGDWARHGPIEACGGCICRGEGAGGGWGGGVGGDAGQICCNGTSVRHDQKERRQLVPTGFQMLTGADITEWHVADPS